MQPSEAGMVSQPHCHCSCVLRPGDGLQSGGEVCLESLAGTCTGFLDKSGKNEAEFRKKIIISINIFCFAVSNKTTEANRFVCRTQLLNISFPSSGGRCFALWLLECSNIALLFGLFCVCRAFPSIFSVIAVISGVFNCA